MNTRYYMHKSVTTYFVSINQSRCSIDLHCYLKVRSISKSLPEDQIALLRLKRVICEPLINAALVNVSLTTNYLLPPFSISLPKKLVNSLAFSYQQRQQRRTLGEKLLPPLRFRVEEAAPRSSSLAGYGCHW